MARTINPDLLDGERVRQTFAAPAPPMPTVTTFPTSTEREPVKSLTTPTAAPVRYEIKDIPPPPDRRVGWTWLGFTDGWVYRGVQEAPKVQQQNLILGAPEIDESATAHLPPAQPIEVQPITSLPSVTAPNTQLPTGGNGGGIVAVPPVSTGSGIGTPGIVPGPVTSQPSTSGGGFSFPIPDFSNVPIWVWAIVGVAVASAFAGKKR